MVKIEVGVNVSAFDAGLKVQVGSGGSTSLPCEGDGLASLDKVTCLDFVPGVMCIIGLQSVGMLDTDEITIAFLLAGEDYFAIEGRQNGVIGPGLEVGT